MPASPARRLSPRLSTDTWAVLLALVLALLVRLNLLHNITW